MRWVFVLFLASVFLSSCAVKQVREPERVPEKKMKEIKTPRKKKQRAVTYPYPPVKGTIIRKDRGIYIKTRCGAFVRAVEGGRVIYAGKDVNAYGWVVIVEQRDGFISVYGRLGKPWVSKGEQVKVRQVLGRVGKYRTSCGLYYELRDKRGNPVRLRVKW